MRRLRENLHSPIRNIQREAEKQMIIEMDRVGSCSLLGEGDLACSFPHECQVSTSRRKKLVVVDNQKLRNMRHREGQHVNGGMFAYCPNCTKYWTNTQLVESCLKDTGLVPSLTKFPDTEARRLKSLAIEHQMGHQVDHRVLDAGYNHHSHTKSCFQCNDKTLNTKKNVESEKLPGKKRKRQCSCECRYRYPKPKRKKLVSKMHL